MTLVSWSAQEQKAWKILYAEAEPFTFLHLARAPTARLVDPTWPPREQSRPPLSLCDRQQSRASCPMVARALAASNRSRSCRTRNTHPELTAQCPSSGHDGSRNESLISRSKPAQVYCIIACFCEISYCQCLNPAEVTPHNELQQPEVSVNRWKSKANLGEYEWRCGHPCQPSRRGNVSFHACPGRSANPERTSSKPASTLTTASSG
jgi:hypothetical protein